MSTIIKSFWLIPALLILWLLLTDSQETRERITLLIAVTAVVISLISAFKDTIFPFNLKVITDTVILANYTSSSRNSLALVLPLFFINDGHGSSVIEGIAIKVEGQNSVKIYTPVAEVDFGKFIAVKRALDADNVTGTFDSFPIFGKSSIKKHILFLQEGKSKKYPFNIWNPGEYKFRIFIKESRHSKPEEYNSMTHGVTEDILNRYQEGTSFSLALSKELDV